METVFIGILVIVFLVAPLVLSIISLIRLGLQGERLRRLEEQTKRLSELLARFEMPPAEKPSAEPAESPGPPAAAPESTAASPPQQVPPIPADAPLPAVDKERWSNIEASIGKRWMTWIGALILFLSAGFFVKYAIDNRWLGPTGRVVLGILFGVALVIFGNRFLLRNMRALGQGLIGGGLAVLYVSLFAAFSFYHLIPQAGAFGLMILVTAAGMALAVLYDAIPVSILAVLGGLLTPIMVSTGRDARDVLFAYLALLNLGVLAVAFYRKWKALDIVAFAGTWILYGGWYARFYAKEALVPAILWLAAFYLIYLLLPFVYDLRHRTAFTAGRFILALANAAAAFAYAYRMLRGEHTHVLGFLALGMAACYIIMGTLTRRRIAGDARGLFAFIGLAVVFLTMAVPLHLRLQGITLAWAAEAPVLLYLGYRYRYFPVRVCGFLVLVLAGFRLFAVHWPLHESLFVFLLNRSFASAMCVPAAAAACAIIHHVWRKSSRPADAALKIVCAFGAGFLALILLHHEVYHYFYYEGKQYLARCAVCWVWILGSAVFLAAGVKKASLPSRIAELAALSTALILAAAIPDPSAYENYFQHLAFRDATRLAVVLMIFAGAFVLRRFPDLCRNEQVLAKILYGIAAFALFVFASLAAYDFCIRFLENREEARWMALMAVSIAWGIYAAVLLVIGFARRMRVVRLTALGLFFLTVMKLVFVDMATVKQLYRIIAFIVLGLLMIGASYLYHRVEKRLGSTSGEDK